MTNRASWRENAFCGARLQACRVDSRVDVPSEDGNLT